MSTDQYILTNNVFNEWELLHDDGRIESAFTRGLRRFTASTTSQLPDPQLRSHISRRVRKRTDREITQTEQTIKMAQNDNNQIKFSAKNEQTRLDIERLQESMEDNKKKFQEQNTTICLLIPIHLANLIRLCVLSWLLKLPC